MPDPDALQTVPMEIDTPEVASAMKGFQCHGDSIEIADDDDDDHNSHGPKDCQFGIIRPLSSIFFGVILG